MASAAGSRYRGVVGRVTFYKLHAWHQPEKGIFRQGIAAGGGVYLECHWGEFVPVADMGSVTKYFFFAWFVWMLCICRVSRE